MLYPLLSKVIRFPLLGYILNGVYFSLIITGILTAAALFYRQMARAGYEKNRLRAFVVWSAVMVFPLGVISSRAANMFYFSPDQWRLSFFIEQFVSGDHQTFHAALFLPFVFLFFLAGRYQFDKRHFFDTLFLYLPVGHAIGRCGCFLVGCCWGNLISFTLFGTTLSFHNPVPLYAIGMNLVLFFFLRNQYRHIYGKNRNQKGAAETARGGSGLIISYYLIGYGSFRMLLEFIRNEKVVGLGMTMAQWSMAGFILCGLISGLYILYFKQYVGKKH